MIAWILLAVSILWSAEASAQVLGHVRTDGGAPLPGAEVVFWGDGQILGSSVTDEVGRFEALFEPAAIQRISVHYIGFGTEIVDGDRIADSPIEIFLTALPVSLPELAVFVTRDICSEPENPSARALWERAREHYRKDTGTRGGWVWGKGLETDVRGDMLGEYADDRLVQWGRSWSVSGYGPIEPTLEELVQEFGYAWPPGRSTSGTERRHLNWSYPEFEQRHAYHFVTDSFGARHTFHLLREESAEVAFCPTNRDRPWIQGRLVFGASGGFVSVRWAARTDDPDEGAGGEALFSEAYDALGGRHLVSGRGVFWRNDGRKPLYPNIPKDFYQLILVNSAWEISTNGVAPDCESRACFGG